MIDQIINVKDLVEQIRKQEPKAREKDKILAAKVWAHQNNRLRDDPYYSAKRFMIDYIEGKYVDYETIRRTRQKFRSLIHRFVVQIIPPEKKWQRK